MIEKDVKSFRKEILELKNKSTAGILLDYDEAIEEIRKKTNDTFKNDDSIKTFGNQDEKDIKKDKEYLRKKIEDAKELIEEIMYTHHIKVKGYESTEGFKKFIKEAADTIAGFDILAEAHENPNITDIFIIKWDTIFVFESGVLKKYHKTFRSPLHFKNYVYNLLYKAGKNLDDGEDKKVDFELYEDRYCATYPTISPKDFSLTIRIHPEEHVGIKDLLDGNVLNKEMLDLIGLHIKGGNNVVIAGITGSGKTTSLRALLNYFLPKLNRRVVTIEDSRELFLDYEHSLELVTSITGDENTSITLMQLIYTSLRLKPDYIIIGEVRGPEAQAASEAMETGHSTWLSMHAGTPINCINRFVNKYLTAMPSLSSEIVERIIGSSIDYIYIQDNIPGIGRRITEIAEISYNFKKRTVDVKPIYKFDIRTQQFMRINNISEEKIELMLRRGVQYNEIENWLKKGEKNE